MQKIQLKLFDRRRNQNFWFHFCYLSDELYEKYRNKFKTANMDAQIKAWIKQDFDFEIQDMEDVYKAKDLIKNLYMNKYPEIALPNDGDRQGWARVWLTEKVKNLLGDNHG